MPEITGARFIAETFKRYGVTHVFFVPAILKTALTEMGKLGINRILTHNEKAAAYMAAGLQDAYLGLSPVIAITGRRPSLPKHRHSYQEI